MSRAAMRTGLLLALLLLGSVGGAAGQERRLAPETAERLRTISERAEMRGVPVILLERKVAEGMSKGITGARLERAIEDYAERLAAARRLAGPDAPPEVVAAAAEALERGVPPDRVRSFLGANPNPFRAAVGLRVFGELLELGVPQGDAARGVNAALDRGMRGERLLALSAAVRRRVAAGEAPAAALRSEVVGRRDPIESRRLPDRRRRD